MTRAPSTPRTPTAARSRPAAPAKRRTQPVRAAREPATALPIARVAVDISLPHLDQPFDYLVAAEDSAAAQPGVRVRVRFSGRLVDGYILERRAESDHSGRLAMLERVVSDERVLTPEIAQLCRAVADRYAGTMADVLRLAVPPRHGRVEKQPPGSAAPEAAPPADVRTTGPTEADGPPGQAGDETARVPPEVPAAWRRYTAGPAFLAAVAEQRPARAVWQALPGEDWPARLAEAAATAWTAGRGAVLIVPDARDLARLDGALGRALPAGAHTVLSADLGPAERYRRFLAVSRGRVRVVAGTRAAAFAPVHRPALLAIFDDGDDLYAEPRAPYPHAREALTIRSAQQATALLIGGFARSAEGQLLVESGWAPPISADRAVLRRSMPRIEAAGDEYSVGADSAAARARLTPAAFAAARQALAAGAPVLVQVPRRGYLPGLACAECHRPARCRRCSGPLAIPAGGGTPTCRWCSVAAPMYACAACGSRRIRATVMGTGRTAEEIGRAFPGARLRTSTGGAVLDEVPAEAAIVVCTPGAEPVADGGYGAALLLDGGLLLGRADLRAAEETLRRWMAAAALVRPAADGGRVVIGADLSLPTVQALIRWDPAGHAAAELAARRELGFPPVAALASLTGGESAVGAALAELELPPSGGVLGPAPIEVAAPRGRSGSAGRAPSGGASGPSGGDPAADPAGGRAGAHSDEHTVRALIRADGDDRRALLRALRVLAAARSARKDSDPVRIQVDPWEFG